MSAEHLPIELLSAHLDGEATAAERARVEAHLAGCEACRATLEDLRRIVAASATLGVPELPEGLRERIAAAVARPAPRRRAWIGAAASLAAVALVATAWVLQGPERAVPAPQLRRVPAPAAPQASGLADATVPPAPPPAPASPRPRSNVKAESKADAGLAADRDEGVRPEQAEAVAPMARFGADDAPAPGFGFVEVAAGGEVDRAALLDALRAIGVSPSPATDDRTIEMIVPRVRWTECREVLGRFGVRIDETKVRSLPGDAIGIRIRTPAP